MTAIKAMAFPDFDDFLCLCNLPVMDYDSRDFVNVDDVSKINDQFMNSFSDITTYNNIPVPSDSKNKIKR